MTDSKKGNNKKNASYEPPRLFDLSGGVAYAASECDNGNRASVGCDNGNTTMATGPWVGNVIMGIPRVNATREIVRIGNCTSAETIF
jgi:hypothetical protein